MTLSLHPTSGTDRRSASLWRNRDYMLLWGGGSLSSIGSGVSRVVFPLLVLDLTHSAAQMGLVEALFALPYAVFGLIAGALVDRWNRKRVMLICDAGRAIVMGSVPLALAMGRLTILQLVLVALLSGFLYTFYDAAGSAALPRVVTPEQLPAAMARSAGMVGTAGLLGPPIGGILYGVGRAVPFLVDTASYAASVLSLLFIRTPFQAERSATPRRIHVEILEGLTWIRRQPLVRFTGLAAATNGMIGTAFGLAIIVAARQHGASAAAIGLMFAIASVGGTTGSFLTGPLVKRIGMARMLIWIPWLMALLSPLYLLTVAPLLLGAITGVIWMISGPFHLVGSSYRRILLPDELQGRVNSAFELAELAADTVSYAIAGVLLQMTGIRPALVIFVSAFLVQALVVSTTPSVRSAPSLP